MARKTPIAVVPEEFERFWRAYPRRVAKQEALRAWSVIRPTFEMVNAMIVALRWQSQQPAWTRDGGQFIPHPATWLRAGRWDDEPFQPVASDEETAAIVALLKQSEPWICRHVPHCPHRAACAIVAARTA